jgi:small subunit ribosomal protein S21
MPLVRLRESEPFEVGLRRFKRLCEKAGVTQEVRRRQEHEKKSQVRKRKKLAARKRYLKKLSRESQARERDRVKW